MAKYSCNDKLKNPYLPIDKEFKAITDRQEAERLTKHKLWTPQLSIVDKPSTQKIIDFPKVVNE